MSTRIRGTPSRISSAPCGTRFAVDTERETLANYVRRIRHEKRLSLRDVSLRSGGRIGNSHISRIENGEASGVSVEKLRALAKGLGVAEEELFNVARGKKRDPIAESNKLLEAAHKFDALPELKRPAVEPLIDILNRELDRLAREED
jgi:transcriptional regulator with XRE-family HTH domain